MSQQSGKELGVLTPQDVVAHGDDAVFDRVVRQHSYDVLRCKSGARTSIRVSRRNSLQLRITNERFAPSWGDSNTCHNEILWTPKPTPTKT